MQQQMDGESRRADFFEEKYLELGKQMVATQRVSSEARARNILPPLDPKFTGRSIYPADVFSLAHILFEELSKPEPDAEFCTQEAGNILWCSQVELEGLKAATMASHRRFQVTEGYYTAGRGQALGHQEEGWKPSTQLEVNKKWAKEVTKTLEASDGGKDRSRDGMGGKWTPPPQKRMRGNGLYGQGQRPPWNQPAAPQGGRGGGWGGQQYQPPQLPQQHPNGPMMRQP